LPSFVVIKRGNQAYSLFESQTYDYLGGARRLSSDEQRILAAQPVWCAKVFSYWATVNYRESYGLWASNGILFNPSGHRSAMSLPHYEWRRIRCGH
jgi:GDP-D-mannose dehydratase